MNTRQPKYIGPAIPEVGGGWVYRDSILSKELNAQFPASEGWRLIPSGINVIVQHPDACYCAPNAPHVKGVSHGLLTEAG